MLRIIKDQFAKFNIFSNHQPVKDEKQGIIGDPIEILPVELVLKVFSYLNLATLGSICCVSKQWKQLANDPKLWKVAIYREIAFGNDKWAGPIHRHR